MELKVNSSVNDAYFDREVVQFTVKLGSGELGRLSDIKKELEKGRGEGAVIVYTLKSTYGKNEVKGIAHVYKDAETAKKILPKYVLEKNGMMNGKEAEEKK